MCGLASNCILHEQYSCNLISSYEVLPGLQSILFHLHKAFLFFLDTDPHFIANVLVVIDVNAKIRDDDNLFKLCSICPDSN